jgi:hypothetical protein
MFTKDLVIKPVYNAFRALALLSGKKEGRISDRLHVEFDEDDLVTVISALSKDKGTLRLLISDNIDMPQYRLEAFKKRLGNKSWNRYTDAYYGNAVTPFKKCLVRTKPRENCTALLPQELKPYWTCTLEGKGKACVELMPEHFQDFLRGITEYQQNFPKYARDVRVTLKNLPFKGAALLTTYIVDKDYSNSCRHNKKTERKPTRNMCGLNGDIDNMVKEARAGAINMSLRLMKQFPLLRSRNREIVDSLFYLGTYTDPNGNIVKNTMWIDKINRDPDVSLEGSKKNKRITINSNGSFTDLITVMPHGIVLVEIRETGK